MMNNKVYFLEVDIDYPKELFTRKKKSWKSWKLNLQHRKQKKNIYIRVLKQALNHGLKLKKVHRVIQFKQKAWLKTCIDMNTELRKNAKNEFEKNFFKLMNNSAFGKTIKL